MRSAIVPLSLTLALAVASASAATIRNGVEVPDGDSVRPSTPLSQSRDATLIDFDDTSQPCAFIQTYPLRDEYAGLGVTFSGPGPADGGAILDACSNFSVSGYSAPNFLAFNCGAQMANGGVPDTPETLTFSELVSFVQIYVGSGLDVGAILSIEAYDDADQLIGVNSIALTSQLQPLAVAAPGIRYVVLGGAMTPCLWVADDLSFEFSTVSVDPATWGETKADYR